MEKQVVSVIDSLVENNIIKSSLREQYVYAAIILAEKVISFITMGVISIITRRVIESLLFLTFFMALRRYTGGYHARSFWRCYFSSIVLYTCVIIFGDNLASYPVTLNVIFISAFLLVFCVGTVNHPNMNYNAEEFREAKKASRCVLFMEILVIFSLDIAGAITEYVWFMKYGVILCAVSLAVSKVIKQEVL